MKKNVAQVDINFLKNQIETYKKENIDFYNWCYYHLLNLLSNFLESVTINYIDGSLIIKSDIYNPDIEFRKSLEDVASTRETIKNSDLFKIAVCEFSQTKIAEIKFGNYNYKINYDFEDNTNKKVEFTVIKDKKQEYLNGIEIKILSSNFDAENSLNEIVNKIKNCHNKFLDFMAFKKDNYFEVRVSRINNLKSNDLFVFYNEVFFYKDDLYKNFNRIIVSNEIKYAIRVDINFNKINKNNVASYFNDNEDINTSIESLIKTFDEIIKNEIKIKNNREIIINDKSLQEENISFDRNYYKDYKRIYNRNIKELEQLKSKLNKMELFLIKKRSMYINGTENYDYICQNTLFLTKELYYILNKKNIRFRLSISIGSLIRALIQNINSLVFYKELKKINNRDNSYGEVMSLYSHNGSLKGEEVKLKLEKIFGGKTLEENKKIMQKIENNLNKVVHNGIVSKVAGKLAFFNYIKFLCVYIDLFIEDNFSIKNYNYNHQ